MIRLDLQRPKYLRFTEKREIPNVRRPSHMSWIRRRADGITRSRRELEEFERQANNIVECIAAGAYMPRPFATIAKRRSASKVH